MIALNNALVGWSAAPASKLIQDVVVLEMDKAFDGDGASGRTWATSDYTSGACDLDWREGRITPAMVFGHMLREGFANPQAVIQAVAEFAKITECRWAAEMMCGIRGL